MKMGRKAMMAILLASVASGCLRWDEDHDSGGGWFGGSTSVTYEVPEDPPAGCTVDGSKWDRMTDLYVATEESVHELITCGQAQVGVAQSLLAMLAASNRELFRGDAFETLAAQAAAFGLYLDMPLDPKGNGRWAMPIATAGEGSEFSITMYEPGSDVPTLYNPFAIDSYVHVTFADNDHGVEAMLDDFSLQNTLYFHWDEEGPLAHLIRDDTGAIPNPIEVRFSIKNMLGLVWPEYADSSPPPDFGPLDAILDLEMTSCVELQDERRGATIRYHVDGRRGVVRNIAASTEVAFDVHGIEADEGSMHLESTAADLRYAGAGSLAGTIDYRIGDDRSGVIAVSDFGDGQPYPESDWSCPAP
ncbi:MAG: hypothetical protein ACOCV4_07010 [Myxococcota bacterium]